MPAFVGMSWGVGALEMQTRQEGLGVCDMAWVPLLPTSRHGELHGALVRVIRGAQERWSEAAALLQQYYHAHGFGITSRNSALRCGLPAPACHTAPPGCASGELQPCGGTHACILTMRTNTHVHVRSVRAAELLHWAHLLPAW